MKTKIFFALFIMFATIPFLSGCSKDETTADQSAVVNNELVGTTWKATIWRMMSLDVKCWLEFESNDRVCVSYQYRNEQRYQLRSNYTLNGKSITFGGIRFRSDSMVFVINSANFSVSTMTVHGSRDGSSTQWTFDKQ